MTTPPEGGTSAEPPAPVDNAAITAFTAGLANAVCGALSDCLGPQALDSFLDRDDCLSRYSESLAQAVYGTAPQSVQNGRIVLHEDKLQQCYDDTRALGCGLQTQRLPVSCQAALEGTVAAGDTCSITADCTGDSFCTRSACPRSCSARVAEGAACTGDDECVNGTVCASAKCAKPAAVGEACEGDSGAKCVLGTACVGNTAASNGAPAMAGVCRAAADIQIAELSESCNFDDMLCKEGYSCASNGALQPALICQMPVASGAVCRPAVPTQCPKGEYCNQNDLTLTGNCVALPTDGQPCTTSNTCAVGHQCLADAAGSGVCKKVQSIGGACTRGAECRSGVCNGGSCTLNSVCE